MQPTSRSRTATPDVARRRQSASRTSSARTRSSRRRVRSQNSPSRLLRSALVIIVVTWVPGAAGDFLGISLLRSWGVTSGYTGFSWALPAFLVGLAAARAARYRGRPWQRAHGVTVGVATAIVLVVGAATVVGG
jgi:hypothetical protein